MTDQELKDLVASLSVSAEQSKKDWAESVEQSKRNWVELAEQSKRDAEQSKREWAELRESQREMGRRIGEAQKETARQINQVNKQIGEIGNKFGYFTEGMALPSMENVLKRRFGMNAVFPRAKLHRNGHTLEIDVLAYDTSGKSDSVFLVEVKSNLTREAIEQLLDTIERFPKFYPDFADRKLFGIVAAVYIPDDLRNVVFKKRLYLARISDDTFKLQTPSGFKPKAFGVNGGGNRRKTNGGKRAKTTK
jgi:hypothetical protein